MSQAGEHALDVTSLRPASADASFRRYFRIDVRADAQQAGAPASFIIMDAPPSHENCQPFVKVAGLLGGAGVHAPTVLAWDEPNGFMLLDDLGSRTYLAELQSLDLASPAGFKAADTLYRDALASLIQLQGIAAQNQVPAYDRVLLQRELDLFTEWYIGRHCGVTLTDKQQTQLAKCFELILKTCEAQPAVLVHRDFHSRNLMLGARPGVLDFQDAVWGPVSYDLVSLLRDAYIEWEEPQQIDWAARYWQQAKKAGVPVPEDFGIFWRDFEWMGLQRHLKVLGIFARLCHRDGKAAYLKDLPLVWRYAHHVAMRYSVLTPLARILEQLAGVKAEDGYTF
ncbi:MAG: aminoglycoside phosphotransferase family protein [Leptothrix sp. (in: b-proteobacteria)]